MPRANIDWTNDFRFAPIKALIGDFYEQNAKEIESRQYTSRASERMFEDLVGEKLPQSYEAFRTEMEHKHSPGYTLVRRASRCPPRLLAKAGNDENWRFKLPGFQTTLHALTQTNDRLRFRHLQALQEEGIIKRSKLNGEKSGPGIYVRADWEKPKQVYVGIVESDLAGRGHTNAGHFVVDWIATSTYDKAQDIEIATHAYLRDIGEAVRKGGKGLFEVHDGNAVELTYAFLRKYFPRLFYNKNRVN